VGPDRDLRGSSPPAARSTIQTKLGAIRFHLMLDRAGRTGIGGRIGAGPINYSDTGAADFLPAPLIRPIQTLQRRMQRRSTLCPASALRLA
jgi:hypothetical protein